MNFDDFERKIKDNKYPRADDFTEIVDVTSSWGETAEVKFFNKKAFKEEVKEFNSRRRMIDKEFKTMVIKEIDLENHPKADRVFEMAWESRRPEGFQAVFEEAQELARLVK